MYNATLYRDTEMDKVSFQYDGTESDLWEKIGKVVYKSQIPNEIDVECDHGTVTLKVGKRGSYIENGVTYPSMFVTEKRNEIYGLVPSKYDKVYLTCIHPESNNYKAYIIRPESDGIWADYGSIDKVSSGDYATIKSPYPSYMYWIRYYEKLSKGYIDQSDILLKSNVCNNVVHKNDTDNNPTGLYALLLSYAKHMVDEHLAFSVTEAQVKRCTELFNQLCQMTDVKSFNKILCELMQISPRKRNPLHDPVNQFMAKSVDDFSEIIEFEENLLNAMNSVAVQNTVQNNKKFDIGFEAFGIKVREATDKEIARVIKMVNDELQGKVRRVWKIDPVEQKKRFKEYCKKNNITNTKKFWHGSRNENWESIIRQSLLIHPNAITTGKMFGYGIYFAPSARKSYGYTSCQGSYWANGNSSNGFMGLYNTAYGDPYYPTSSGDKKNEMLMAGKNCVHAKRKNIGLYNDEVVFYNENAICIEYLVEFV